MIEEIVGMLSFGGQAEQPHEPESFAEPVELPHERDVLAYEGNESAFETEDGEQPPRFPSLPDVEFGGNPFGGMEFTRTAGIRVPNNEWRDGHANPQGKASNEWVKNISNYVSVLSENQVKQQKVLNGTKKSLEHLIGGVGSTRGGVVGQNWTRSIRNRKLAKTNASVNDSQWYTIRGLSGRVNRMGETLAFEFGEKRRYIRALLAAAQSLPGIRAFQLVNHDYFEDLMEAFSGLEVAVEVATNTTTGKPYASISVTNTDDFDSSNVDETAIGSTTITSGSGTTADVAAVEQLRDTVQAELAALKAEAEKLDANQLKVLDYIDENATAISSIADGGVSDDAATPADVRAAAEKFSGLLGISTFVELSKYVPSTLRDNKEALTEVAGKYLLGQPREESDGLLSGFGL